MCVCVCGGGGGCLQILPYLLIGMPHVSLNNLERDVKLNNTNKQTKTTTTKKHVLQCRITTFQNAAMFVISVFTKSRLIPVKTRGYPLTSAVTYVCDIV